MARNLGNPGLSDLQGGASGSLVLGKQGPVCHVGFPAQCRPWKSHGFGSVQSWKQQAAPLQVVKGLGCFLSVIIVLKQKLVEPQIFWRGSLFLRRAFRDALHQPALLRC